MKYTLALAAPMLAALLVVGQSQAAGLDLSSRIYAVTHVAPDDGLNLRSTPGADGKVVVILPSNAKGLLSMGVAKKTGNSTWMQVTWSGKQGWVNKYYLREDVDTSTYNPAAPQPVAVPAIASTVSMAVPATAATTAPTISTLTTSTPAKRNEVVMECGGTEPFWSVTISDKEMKVNMVDGPKYSVPVEFRQQSANNTSIAIVAGNRSSTNTTAILQKVESCSDGMSDKNYPYSITAVLDSHNVVSGCCGISDSN